MISVELVTQLLATATVVLDGAIVLIGGYFLLALATGKKKAFFKNPVISLIGKNGRLLAFVFALSSMLGSLFYSDIAGYAPCTLCWYQRIFMYPLVFLLGIAIIKNKRDIATYVMPMAVIGGVIALYHYYLQRGGESLVSCSTVGYSASCSDYFTMSYGYITIPVMSLSVFVAIGASMWLYSIYTKSTKK